MSFPPDMKKPTFPKGNKFPAVPGNDTPKNEASGSAPIHSNELPSGKNMSDATTESLHAGVEGSEDRDSTPVEKSQWSSSKPHEVTSQNEALKKNDPTQPMSEFTGGKKRPWQDKNFDNRRMLY